MLLPLARMLSSASMQCVVQCAHFCVLMCLRLDVACRGGTVQVYTSCVWQAQAPIMHPLCEFSWVVYVVVCVQLRAV